MNCQYRSEISRSRIIPLWVPIEDSARHVPRLASATGAFERFSRKYAMKTMRLKQKYAQRGQIASTRSIPSRSDRELADRPKSLGINKRKRAAQSSF
jgi:hypothetical protein